MTEQNKIIKLSHMLLIGALEKNSGKTTLSVKIIRKFTRELKQVVYAVKVTILRDFEGRKGYSITEETHPEREKDTGRLLAAGARQVFWIKTDQEHTATAIKDLMTKIPDGVLILCESNSLRLYVQPAYFIMVKRDNSDQQKTTAAAVDHLVDIRVTSYLMDNIIFYSPNVAKRLTLKEGTWYWPSEHQGI